MKVGRVGIDVDTRSPSTWEHSGDEVTVTGNLYNATAAAAKALRQQLLGYAESAEVVPVIIAEDSDLDGFYQVTSVTVETVDGISTDQNYYPFQLGLRRVASYQTALTEATLSGGLRTNAHSVVVGSTTPWFAVPDAATAVHPGNTTSLETGRSRTGDDGDMIVFEPASQRYNDDVVNFRLAPADWYDGHAYIKVGGYEVTGRQTLLDTSDWEIGNHLLKITPGASSALFDFAGYDGSSYEPSTPHDVDVGLWDGTPFSTGSWKGLGSASIPGTTANTMRILFNRPWLVAVRFTFGFETGANGYGQFTVDLSLRRGDRLLHGVIKSHYSDQFGINIDDADGSTDETDSSGMYLTSNDSDGNRWVAFFDEANTTDNTNNIAVLSATGTEFHFGIGQEIGGSGSSQPDRKADLKAHYFAAQGEHDRVVEA